MFNPNERIIGAAYVMQENLVEIVFCKIKTLDPIENEVTNAEVAEAIMLDQEKLTTNQKRERIIGAATVMRKDDACEVWNMILETINIPEATDEDLEQALDKF